MSADNETKPCIACLIRPRREVGEYLCWYCLHAWPLGLALDEFALKRREEVLKPNPMVQPPES